MTFKEFTEWVQGLSLVKDLLTPKEQKPAKAPRKPRKPKDTDDSKANL